MKIRHPWLLRATELAGAAFLRAWMRTVRFECVAGGPGPDPRWPGPGERYLYALWHEHMLLAAANFARPDIRVLISRSRDGQLIAGVCRSLGFSVVRGSTTRGGLQVVLQLLRAGTQAHLALTPDGPRGPRRVVKPGLVYLAARTGRPIVPVGFGYRNPWRLSSWDRTALPRPWSRTTCVVGVPITIPAAASRTALEVYRRQVEEALQEADDVAQRWAEEGAIIQPAPLAEKARAA